MKDAFTVRMEQACAVQRQAELQSFDALAGDTAALPLLPDRPFRRRKRVAAAVLAACLLFTTVACAVWPTVAVKVLGGKAYLTETDGGDGHFRRFTLPSLPEGCEATWNPAEGYWSCTVRKGTAEFTVVLYPPEHRAMIIGDNADGTMTPNDKEGIAEDFCLLSRVEDMTEEDLAGHSVVCWPADNGYFVVLNHSWTDWGQMRQILQGIQS